VKTPEEEKAAFQETLDQYLKEYGYALDASALILLAFCPKDPPAFKALVTRLRPLAVEVLKAQGFCPACTKPTKIFPCPECNHA
jgi:hypothetical protein